MLIRSFQSEASALAKLFSNRSSSFLRCYRRPFSSSSSEVLTPAQEFNKIITDDYDGANNFQLTLKVVQRFKKDPSTWPADELPFGLTHPNFIGKVLHPVELRPERAFANFVPKEMFALRHIFRTIRARFWHNFFSREGIFDQRPIIEGVRQAFEVVCQAICKRNLSDLVKRGICSDKIVDRFTGVMGEMSPRQHALLDVTKDDIISVAPGALGPFQNIRLGGTEEPLIIYSILCCAFFKKLLLFKTVDPLPLVESEEAAKRGEQSFVDIPDDYGYKAPRLIFAYMDFSHSLQISSNMLVKVNPDVNLSDFQFLVM